MAKIKDILAIESRRVTAEQCRTVYLFQEGTFYRAYEWSAWLCVRYIQQFKTTKRMFKNEDASIVFVGFPVTSLEKYTVSGAEVTVAEDKSVCLVLPETIRGNGRRHYGGFHSSLIAEIYMHIYNHQSGKL